MKMIQIYDASSEEKDKITKELIKYNHTRLPSMRELPFMHVNRCIKDGNEVVGGILAEIYWGILFIEILWVDEKYRNIDYASALIADVENKAKEINCKISHLDTFDFQAKGLYEKLGNKVFGVLEDCPEGHNRFYMSKKLF